jgi:hypothetical protein
MTWSSRALLLLVLTSVLLIGLTPIRLDDVFLYLAFGLKIFETGSLADTDPFIFTIPNYEWHIGHEWLAFVFYYAVYALGAYPALIWVRALFASLAFLLLWIIGESCKVALWLRLFAMSFVLYLAQARIFRDRSSIFGDLFAAALLWALADKKLNSMTSRKKWGLPLFFWLWIQLHPAFILGYVFLTLFIFSSWKTWSAQVRRDWILVGIASAAVGAVSPSGPMALLWPIQKFLSTDWQFFKEVNLEWIPVLQADFLTAPYKVTLALWATFVFLLSARSSVQSKNVFLVLCSLAVSYLTFSATRFLSMGALCLGVLFFVSIQDLHWFRKNGFNRVSTGVSFVVPLIWLFVFFSHPESDLGFLKEGRALYGTVPTKATEVLLSLPPGPVFNDWELGGYLVWRLGQRQKIAAHGFISDIQALKENYYRFSYSPKDWDEIINGKKVEYFMFRSQTLRTSQEAHAGWLQALYGKEWIKIYEDPAAVIFKKNH